MKVDKNDKNPSKTDTALCGSDILNGYMSSRIIRSQFLMDKDAISKELTGCKLATTNIDSDITIGTRKLSP